jgi:hypothetical protein
MTEAEWLACADPTLMLAQLGRTASDRKLRLFTAACCRRLWPLLAEGRGRHAVEAVEAFADGKAGWALVERASRSHARTLLDSGSLPAHWAVGRLAQDAPYFDASGVMTGLADALGPGEPTFQCGALRDVFGNPFRPATIDPAWRTPTVTGLATAAYEERFLPSGELDSARLAVLCDALLDAGCPSDAEALLHLRSPGPHCRGCWALDLLLIRE